jgi:lipopolysaccharide transport system ATP-binding protein
MSSEESSELAIEARGLSKCYALFDRPSDRLWQMLSRGRRKFYRDFWALRDVDLSVGRGEVMGIVGRNGAGKSTLLQLICRTLTPTSGTLAVRGRVSALLELGAGFNPDFSGRENVILAASILGLTAAEIEARYEEIVEFSGIRDFIEQPVKTYSSGMYVRLAFSVATSVDPNILIIDEALSVGDGEFARKSFDRIMALKERGATILFCSHSLYLVETLCSRVLWLDHGRTAMLDEAARVVSAYDASINQTNVAQSAQPTAAPPGSKSGRLLRVEGRADGMSGKVLTARSEESNVSVTVAFEIDPTLPPPSVALGIANAAGITIASAGTANDGFTVPVDAAGRGLVTVSFPRLPLLKGDYSVTVFLACENAIHIYDFAERVLELHVTQKGTIQGVAALPHAWRAGS